VQCEHYNSLVDNERQWFKANNGLIADVPETPRSLSFCAQAIQQPEQLCFVPDALLDDRFRNNGLVRGR
jgi:hypothetical protein